VLCFRREATILLAEPWPFSRFWRTFGEGELKRTEKRQTSPLVAGEVIRQPSKVPEITNRITAPVETKQYHQLCAQNYFYLAATAVSQTITDIRLGKDAALESARLALLENAIPPAAPQR
jgi:hypothetical protein